jgi:hypothetical protein
MEHNEFLNKIKKDFGITPDNKKTNQIRDLFVSYDIALKLYHVGFYETCLGNFSTSEAWKYDGCEGSFHMVETKNKINASRNENVLCQWRWTNGMILIL